MQQSSFFLLFYAKISLLGGIKHLPGGASAVLPAVRCQSGRAGRGWLNS